MRHLWIALVFLMAACNNADKSDPADKANDSTPATATGATLTETACYLAVQNRDSILLQLHLTDSVVTGQMQYDNFEMDGNIGTIQATRQHNRIVGYFHFFSEGMWSVREIVFEQRNGHIVQAQTADMRHNGDTTRFNHEKALTFDEQRFFNKIDCRQLRFDAVPR